MTDTQERVVRDEIARGQIFGFLGRKLNNFIASEWFIYAPWVVVVAVLFYHHHTIKSLEARFENLDDHHTIKFLEARFKNLDDHHTIKSLEARFENLDDHHTIKSLEARFKNLDDHHTIKSLEARFENLEAEFVILPRTSEHKNCAELYKSGKITSGVYTINLDDSGPDFRVFCDQKTAGGGWTVVQKRLDGSVNFYRGWSDYKEGFGSLHGEFWLGLDKIHHLTKSSSKLRVDLEDFDGNTVYAEYDMFAVANENKKYELSIKTFSGTAGDSFLYHHGQPFTTKDQDNGRAGFNCAKDFKGAWWYAACHSSNLNGLYYQGEHLSYADGVNWYSWKGLYYSVKRAEMKIRPVEFQ